MTPGRPTPAQLVQAAETSLTPAKRYVRFSSRCPRAPALRGSGQTVKQPPAGHSAAEVCPPSGHQFTWTGRRPRASTPGAIEAAAAALPGREMTATRGRRNSRRTGIPKCWWTGQSGPSGGNKHRTRPRSASPTLGSWPYSAPTHAGYETGAQGSTRSSSAGSAPGGRISSR